MNRHVASRSLLVVCAVALVTFVAMGMQAEPQPPIGRYQFAVGEHNVPWVLNTATGELFRRWGNNDEWMSLGTPVK